MCINAINHYLDQQAESETALTESINFKHYMHCLIIPIFDEVLEQIAPISNVNYVNNKHRILIIVVVNTPSNLKATADNVLRTHQILADIDDTFTKLDSDPSETACLYTISENIDLLTINRSHQTTPIPHKEGVGLARKIACDIACNLFVMNIIETPWLYLTDADVILPNDYFKINASDRNSALTFPFDHYCDSTEINNAISAYEYSLHYYVEGLKWANSPYAFHTIGSTMAVNMHHYALARGFPKRSGGEDFYLLNKLNKIAPVKQLNSTNNNPILIKARLSERVPFGTGPALRSIKELEKQDKLFSYYNPIQFEYLKMWLLIIKDSDHLTPLEHYHQLIEQRCHNSEIELNSDHIIRCLESVSYHKGLAHAIKHSNNQEGFHKHMHTWFDAFKTLKFMHFLRDHYYPKVSQDRLTSLATFKLPRFEKKQIR